MHIYTFICLYSVCIFNVCMHVYACHIMMHIYIPHNYDLCTCLTHANRKGLSRPRRRMYDSSGASLTPY